MLNHPFIYISLVMGILICSFTSDATEQAPNAFGEGYQSVPPVVNELTQVVYYRAKNYPLSATPGNVYVDGRYHTSLLPGGFTSFCMRAGQHQLGAFVNDPQYRGKSESFAADFQGGRTYYLRVDEQQQLNQPPQAVKKNQGEPEVKSTRRQIHAYSRATSVVPCVFDRAASQAESLYVFDSRSLFKQEIGITLLSDEGIEQLNEMVVNLRQQHPMLHSVLIKAPSQTDAGHQVKAIRNALMLVAVPDAIIRSEIGRCDQNCHAGQYSIQILAR